PAATGHVVALLDVLRQRVEGLEHLVGLVDELLRNAVVADAGEAPLAIGGAEFVDEGLAVLRTVGVGEAADVEGRDSRGHGSLVDAPPLAGALGPHDTAPPPVRRRPGRRPRGGRGWRPPGPRRRLRRSRAPPARCPRGAGTPCPGLRRPAAPRPGPPARPRPRPASRRWRCAR